MTLDLTKKRILLTGGAGFLGSAIHATLLKRGVPNNNIIIPRSTNYNLTRREAIERLFDNQPIDIVIHAAAKVGGIGANRDHPGLFFYENLIMGVELMEVARLRGVEKFVAIGTICAYPKYAPIPFKEDDLWNGYPEETNAPYGLAKKMLLVQAQAYRQEYGFNAITLFPVNLYGPGDNFEPASSHVIPALIKKCVDAIDHNKHTIELWGDGSATREFLYVDDAAEGIVRATEQYNKPEPVNIGKGEEISIRELIALIQQATKFKGTIEWDTTKPNGQPRRMLDTTRAREEFGFVAKTNFHEGLAKTITWYRENRRRV
jgi:GDP-L-fucose synthase